ncbi:unnamed protein product [Blepharisma stoltei]|uniref:Translin-associated factor X-interacting protein 1 N-terminal domain-containing protein n=1 Tax=Blepharisma stoltei TaxID=1481888 RepID=A0AAU9J764_9CILI|nr:unnamed protein product [Blepharisma stoltei]
MEYEGLKTEMKLLKPCTKSLTDLANQFFITDASTATGRHQSATRRSSQKFSSPKMFLNVIDGSSKQIITIPDKEKYFIDKARPVTASFQKNTSKQILGIHSQIGHSNNSIIASKKTSDEDLLRYLKSIKCLKELNTDIEINYLLANSNPKSSFLKSVDSFLNKLHSDIMISADQTPSQILSLNREAIIQKHKEYLGLLRQLYKENPDSVYTMSYEIIWRFAIKLFDNALIVHDYQISALEESYKYKMKRTVDKYEIEILKLKESLNSHQSDAQRDEDKLKQRIDVLKEEIYNLTQIIEEKENTIKKMLEFDTREYTLLRVGKMIKGLGNFTAEIEEENSSQLKILSSLSGLIKAQTSWLASAKRCAIEIQTDWSLPQLHNVLPEHDFPIIYNNYISRIASKAGQEFKIINETDAIELCESILYELNSTCKFDEILAMNLIKKFPIDQKLISHTSGLCCQLLTNPKNWAKFYRRLIFSNPKLSDAENSYIKDIFNIIRSCRLDKADQFSLKDAIKCTQTIFCKDKAKEFEIFNSLIFRNTESFEESSSLEIFLIRLAQSMTGEKKDLHKSLNASVSKAELFEYISSLGMWMCESELENLWNYLDPFAKGEIQIYMLMNKLNIPEMLIKSKLMFVEKYEYLNKALDLWEKCYEARKKQLIGLISCKTYEECQFCLKKLNIVADSERIKKILLENFMCSTFDEIIDKCKLIDGNLIQITEKVFKKRKNVQKKK